MEALADNICHVLKGDDKIPRFDGVRADGVPNREDVGEEACGWRSMDVIGGNLRLALHSRSD